MTLDRLQSKFGVFNIAPENVMGTTGTASTVASNQYPGGVQLGQFAAVIAGSNSTNGGAIVNVPIPRGMATTDFQSFAAAGMITHDNAPTVLISVSTTGVALNMQQAVSHGQIVDLVFIPGTTGSIVSTLATTGFGGTTTAACAVIDAAITFASTGAIRLQAFAQRGGTATTNVPFVWHRIAYS